MQPPDIFDTEDHEPDNEDGIRCNRCGTEGLYWQTVTQADGRGEKHALFDSRTKRRHVCAAPSTDAFGVVE